ncbi:4'-phosphopantetheinyl transferase superfamily protein [Puniceicoccaceae bacterium K14]|nr:4'-phosphopantetheinyl transferase superfamily protein [Puniceicoccaceae bacterium K14]
MNSDKCSPLLKAARPLDDEVHIWYADLDSTNLKSDFLASDEEERRSRFKFDIHRERFSKSRNILRFLLGSYLSQHPTEIRFAYAAKGKPQLEGFNRLNFNISHSDSHFIAAFSTGSEIGVDIEGRRPPRDEAQLVNRFFHEKERVEYSSLPPELKTQAFYNGWTRKEALIKAHGDGLQIPLDSFQVSLDPRTPCQILSKAPAFIEKSSSWSLVDISQSSQEYTAALAAKHERIITTAHFFDEF